MQEKPIILDFDYTLFDAKAFKQALAKSLERFGISKKIWQETYDSIRYRHGKDADYIPAWHLKILAYTGGNNIEQLEKSYAETIAQARNYLYNDSLDFLEKMRAENHPLHLITFGSPEFQMQKIKSSGIDKYFQTIICTNKNKYEVTNQVPSANFALFINDNPYEIAGLKKTHPKASFIQIARNQGKKFDLKLNNIQVEKNLHSLKL